MMDWPVRKDFAELLFSKMPELADMPYSIIAGDEYHFPSIGDDGYRHVGVVVSPIRELIGSLRSLEELARGDPPHCSDPIVGIRVCICIGRHSLGTRQSLPPECNREGESVRDAFNRLMAIAKAQAICLDVEPALSFAKPYRALY